MAQIGMAWVLKNPVVTAPIVGPTKPQHLPDSVAALDVQLTDEENPDARGAVRSSCADWFRLVIDDHGWARPGAGQKRPGATFGSVRLRARGCRIASVTTPPGG